MRSSCEWGQSWCHLSSFRTVFWCTFRFDFVFYFFVSERKLVKSFHFFFHFACLLKSAVKNCKSSSLPILIMNLPLLADDRSTQPRPQPFRTLISQIWWKECCGSPLERSLTTRDQVVFFIPRELEFWTVTRSLWLFFLNSRKRRS